MLSSHIKIELGQNAQIKMEFEKTLRISNEFAGCESCYLLEEAGEMIGKFEAEEVGGLADVMSVHQQALGLIDDIIVDVSDGCATCGLVDDVAKIARGIGKLGSTVSDGGQSMP